MEEENARLSACMAAAAKGADHSTMQDLLANMDRLRSEKSKVWTHPSQCPCTAHL